MLSFEPRIALVDDKFEEVKGIFEKYQKESIGVKYFNAHLTNGEEKPITPYSDINLIYLDVLFTGSLDDYDPTYCAAWIEKLIPKHSFYILILWSKETDTKDEILLELARINRSPFVCIAKQKTDFQIKDGWDFDKLDLSIKDELNKYPEIEELAIWKKSVLFSSNSIIGHLAEKMQPDSLKKKLQKIILGHGGTYLLGEGNENEKRKVLFDAIDNILSSNSKSTRPTEEISQTNKDSLYNITGFPVTDIDSKLNSWFHFNLIEKENIGVEEITPGIISLNQSPFLKRLYSILDDTKLSPKFQSQIDSQTTTIEDISVVLIRPCDYAQGKFGKNIKLLSGIKINNPKRLKEEDLTKNQKKNKDKYIGRLDINISELPDSVKLFDHLHFSETEKDVTLIFDFRYVFSVPEKIFIDKFENLKLFNKELLSEIQVEYGSYSSRLGITQII